MTDTEPVESGEMSERRRTPAHQEWEYKVLKANQISAVEYEINLLGIDGWELVGVQQNSAYGDGVLYFKRPLIPTSENWALRQNLKQVSYQRGVA